MKTLASLTLLAGLAMVACNLPTGPSSVALSNQRPQVTLTSVGVSPRVVRAGSEFTASASATFYGCGGPLYSVGYANHMYPGAGGAPTFTLTLTAVMGDTVVTFQAYCGYASTGVESLTIQVVAP